jgi:D-beta-D-heptose 7-phosphate kinase/D-beta-D-heptose 1-phosphate adenosyltransferase
VADVSGAGDTVVATLTAAMAAGVAAETAIHLANVAAGLVVAKLGTATLTRAELATALERESGGGKG